MRERLTSLYTPKKNYEHAITNAHKIKDKVTDDQIRDVFIRNEPPGYVKILNLFKAKSKN